MQRLTPFAQSGASPMSAGAENEAKSALDPLISATGVAPWVFVVAFIVIFIIVLIAIIRSRVIKPAERAARDSNIFEPAGADAEITFEPPADEPASEKKSRWKRRNKKEEKKSREEDAEPAEPLDRREIGDLDLTAEHVVEEPEQPHKRRGPFAGLFSRHEEPEDAHPIEKADTDFEPELLTIEGAPTDREFFTAPEEPQPANDEHAAPTEEAYEDDYWAARHEEDDRQRLEYERAEEERQRAIEEAERARAEAEAAQLREDAEREAAEREASFERRKAEAALDQRMQSLAAMQRKLDDKAEMLSSDAAAIHHRIGSSLEQKFASLSGELYERLNGLAAQISDSQSGRQHFLGIDQKASDEIAEHLSVEISGLREATDKAISKLADRIDNLSAAQNSAPGSREEMQRLNKLLAERAAPAVAGVLQLNDLVRSALPAERFAFDKELASGATADCLITPPEGVSAYAVDARFPVEAFERYARAEAKDQKAAETAYRRAVLRHMVFIAEKLIAPPETADFAIMFTPSETIFNDLHQNFADIIQDSYRARIWITSPTSLMATLHMMGAAAASFAKDNTTSGADATLRAEITAISERLARLEDDLARHTPTTSAGAEAGDLIQPAPFPEGEPPETHENGEEAETPTGKLSEGEITENEAEDETEDAKIARPPFPLR